MHTHTLAQLLGATLTLALTACSHKDAGFDGQSASPQPPLPAVAAQRISVADELGYDGILEATNQSAITAQTAGRIIALPVDVNDVVQAGEVLVRLRDAVPRAQTAGAAAALKEAQAEYARVKAVYERKLVPQAMMDRATAARDAAQAAYDTAAEHQGDTLIRAPYAGVVITRSAQLGETAMPGMPLLSLLSLDRVRVIVDIPQQDAARLRSQAGARVQLPDGHWIDAASVQRVPYADTQTHSVRARVELPAGGPRTGLYPGQLVKVRFSAGSRDTLAVAATAVAQRGELSGLYVLDAQNHPVFRSVRLGEPLPEQRLEVLAGLAEGERVVSDPVAAAQSLHSGSHP